VSIDVGGAYRGFGAKALKFSESDCWEVFIFKQSVGHLESFAGGYCNCLITYHFQEQT